MVANVLQVDLPNVIELLTVKSADDVHIIVVQHSFVESSWTWCFETFDNNPSPALVHKMEQMDIVEPISSKLSVPNRVPDVIVIDTSKHDHEIVVGNAGVAISGGNIRVARDLFPLSTGPLERPNVIECAFSIPSTEEPHFFIEDDTTMAEAGSRHIRVAPFDPIIVKA